MRDSQKPRGPLTHRVLIGFFTILLAILAYWSLDFIMDDIEALQGPQYEDVEARVVDKSLLGQERKVTQEAARIEQQRNELTEQKAALQTSTNSSQETMKQLLEIQRLALQKGAAPTEAETKALADSKRLFLSNQAKYQNLNDELENLRGQARAVREQYDGISAQLKNQREEAHKQHQALLKRHEWKKAALELLVLIPLLLVAYYFFRTKRSSFYAPIIYAPGAALVLKLFEVLHHYFPSRYFKYILMAIAITLVVQLLLYLLRMVVSPKKDFLLKQYREAYERFVCPVCEYPIRRGPLRYAFWTKRTIRKLVLPEPTGHASDDPYACPACGVTLYEKCPACQGVRHSMLPHCEKCGASKELATSA
jgi:predicted RNA-binding Zn-ribbon protein involved in translation (DUF1610 family)